MILKNFFSQLKKGYFRQPFVKFLQQLNDYSELVLKLVIIFLLVVTFHWPQNVVILYGP